MFCTDPEPEPPGDIDLEQLTASVLGLPSADHAQLLASIEGPEAEQAAYDAAWEAEFDRREAEAEADPSTELPAEEALAAIRAELAAARAAGAEAARAPSSV